MAFLLFLLWPAAEIYVAIQIADAIGVLWTVLLLIASWPIGSWAIRTEGRAAWRKLGEAVAAGRSPGREVLNGALVVAGGALLLVPGFITDVLGLLLLLAPSRALTRRVVVRNLQSRFVVRATGADRARRSYDVDSTATDVGQAKLAAMTPAGDSALRTLAFGDLDAGIWGARWPPAPALRSWSSAPAVRRPPRM